jgi:hypothetical protein
MPAADAGRAESVADFPRGIFQQMDPVAQRHQQLRLINQAKRQLSATPRDGTAWFLRLRRGRRLNVPW